MAQDYNKNPLPSHETFTPPVNPIGVGVQDWARGFRERTLHPLETIAGKAKEVSRASLEETLPTMLGVGMMTGVGSKLADTAKLEVAQAMQKAGKSIAEIKQSTGWFLGAADEMPRFQISDAGSMLNIEKLHGAGEKLSDVLHHPELYKAYPHLKDLRVTGTSGVASGAGAQSPLGIKLGIRGEDTEKIRSTLLHEIQHAVQQYEGHAAGGTPMSVVTTPEYANLMQKKWTQYLDQGLTNAQAHMRAQNEAAVEVYKRLAGEQEAKLTQKTMYLTPEELKSYIPVYDVPVTQQVLPFNLRTAKAVK